MYDFNEVSIKHPAHFTNDLTCWLFICLSGGCRLLLGAIIMTGEGGRRGQQRGNLRKKIQLLIDGVN